MAAVLLPLAMQGSAPGREADREKLLAGVEGIPKFGVPGPVAIFGEGAFPVIAGGGMGQPGMALCAAGELGKGRVVLFGHTGYLDGKVGDAGLGRLLVNAANWCAGGRKPRVGARSAAMVDFFSGEGMEAKRLGGAMGRGALDGIDVLILNAQGMTDPDESAAVGEFVSAGGGLIAAATGWAFEQTSGGKDLVGHLAINRALASAGLGFTDATLRHEADRFSTGGSPPALLNAHAALEALAGRRASGLPREDLAQATAAIELALSIQPAGTSALIDRVKAVLRGMGAAAPSEEKPLRADKAAPERARLAIEARLSQLGEGLAGGAHPAAAKFPGAVPASAPRATRDVEIDPRSWGWHSTGLYAAPGETITVTVPGSVAGAGCSVRIGCHTDRLYHSDSWCRAPEIARRVPIRGPVTAAANAFGGPVYIELPEKGGPAAPFRATIAGAVPAPLFVLGKDDDAKWNSEIKRRPGPWAEFACDRVVLTCPSEVARRVSNPTELMRFWTEVLDAQAELAGIPAERRRPERIVADVQISAGYMHSGYPIMVPLKEAETMVTRSGKRAPGWGFYHELGHNHQRPEWTFDGTVEVTCNLFSLWSFHRALGEPDPTVGHEAMSPERREARLKKHLASGAPFEAWKADPFLALTQYWQLVDAFGWEALKRVIASYGGGEFGPPPKSDAEKRDQWMVRYSRVTGKNLGPFFDRWGVPVSEGAKASVAAMEAWIPKGM